MGKTGELIRFGKERIHPSLLKTMSDMNTEAPSIIHPDIKGDTQGWKQARPEVLWQTTSLNRKRIMGALKSESLLKNPSPEEKKTIKALAENGKLNIKITKTGIEIEKKE